MVHKEAGSAEPGLADEVLPSPLTATQLPWWQFRADPGLDELILEYGEEHAVQPDPDWDEIKCLCAVGDLFCFDLRDAGRMVGFCLCRREAELAFKGKVLAFASFIFVRAQYRGPGTHILLNEVERYMRNLGANHFALHHSPRIDCLAPLGTATMMRVWIKEL